MRSRGTIWFLFLAFIPAWLAWAAAGTFGWSMDDPGVQLLTAAFVPAAAAIVVRRWVTCEGFADAGLRLGFARHWRSYAFALALSPGILAVALSMAWLSGDWDPSTTIWSEHWMFLIAIPIIPVLVAPIFFGEEFGWTAYLRDRLLPSRPVATTFATGFVWGVWHWPLPWAGYFGESVGVGEAVVSMLLWIPLSVLLEFLIGFVWSRSGSVWPSVLVHGGGNLVVAGGLDSLTGSSLSLTASTVYYIAAMIPFVGGVLMWGRWSAASPSVLSSSR